MPLRTPLHPLHATAGATMFEFGGWEMPLSFTGVIEEHMAVREGVGLFDVSHMGKVLVSGEGARAIVEGLSTNAIPRRPLRSRYTYLLDGQGRILDDVIVTCIAPDRFFVVCNAAPRRRIVSWLERHLSEGGELRDVTDDYLCLALQGPKAARVLQLLTTEDLDAVGAFRGTFLNLLLGPRLGTARPASPAPLETEGWGALGDACLVTRTGYTGEDGFELFPHRTIGEDLWHNLMAAGEEAGIRAVGLGARDTLRLEKGYLLSGTDFDGRQTPLECAGEKFVKWDHDFAGREALLRQREAGDHDRLVGLVLQEPGVPRHGNGVVREGEVVGTITSGTHSPVLKRGIALARVRANAAPDGAELSVVVRSRSLRAIVTTPPFV